MPDVLISYCDNPAHPPKTVQGLKYVVGPARNGVPREVNLCRDDCEKATFGDVLKWSRLPERPARRTSTRRSGTGADRLRQINADDA